MTQKTWQIAEEIHSIWLSKDEISEYYLDLLIGFGHRSEVRGPQGYLAKWYSECEEVFIGKFLVSAQDWSGETAARLKLNLFGQIRPSIARQLQILDLRIEVEEERVQRLLLAIAYRILAHDAIRNDLEFALIYVDPEHGEITVPAQYRL